MEEKSTNGRKEGVWKGGQKVREEEMGKEEMGKEERKRVISEGEMEEEREGEEARKWREFYFKCYLLEN